MNAIYNLGSALWPRGSSLFYFFHLQGVVRLNTGLRRVMHRRVYMKRNATPNATWYIARRGMEREDAFCGINRTGILVISMLLHPKCLVSFPRIPFPETIKLRIRDAFRPRKNSCRASHYDVTKYRIALWLQAREALWSNCKRTQSSESRFVLCKALAKRGHIVAATLLTWSCFSNVESFCHARNICVRREFWVLDT